MPWDEESAPKHTRKAKTDRERRIWKQVANKVYDQTGDEARAIRAANAALNRKEKRKSREQTKLGRGE